MAELVNQNYSNASEHTQIFAIIDILTNTLSLISQLFFVRYSIKKLGVGVTLTILPIVSTIGFILLSINPIFIILAIFQIFRRSIGFGFSKPTSDMLYTVVSRNARYKTKNFIETAVFRGGDVIATWVIKMLNLGLSTISLICIPITLIGVILALLIGNQYNKFYKKLSRKTNG
jgi:AAA family ATP:ADP antiporter